MKVHELEKKLFNLFPQNFAYEWDNVGLIIGSGHQKINRVLTCLEITENVILEAIELKANVIVAHHPLIFKPLSKLTLYNAEDGIINLAIKNDIAIICMHTNVDVAPFGLNDWLASVIEIEKTKILDITGEEEIEEGIQYYGFGRFGYIKPTVLEELATTIKVKFGLDNVQIVGPRHKEIKKVAIVGGSGAKYIKMAKRNKCDVLITGDVDFHSAIWAENNDICLIDAGHIIEIIFNDVMAEIIKEFDQNLDVIASDIDVNPLVTI